MFQGREGRHPGRACGRKHAPGVEANRCCINPSVRIASRGPSLLFQYTCHPIQIPYSILEEPTFFPFLLYSYVHIISQLPPLQFSQQWPHSLLMAPCHHPPRPRYLQTVSCRKMKQRTQPQYIASTLMQPPSRKLPLQERMWKS